MQLGQIERVAAAATFLRDRGVESADVAIVLGSGLGAFADRLDSAPPACPTARFRTGRRRR